LATPERTSPVLKRRKDLVRRTPLRRRRRSRSGGLVDEGLLDGFRAKRHCEWCGRKLGHRPHAHHIHSRGAGRVDVAVNVVALGCAFDCNCHGRAHAGEIGRRQLLAVAARREGMTVRDAEELIWRLRRRRRE
jgi:hypothetical protein